MIPGGSKYPRLSQRYRTLAHNREELEKQIKLSQFGVAGQDEIFSKETLTTPLLLAQLDEEMTEIESAVWKANRYEENRTKFVNILDLTTWQIVILILSSFIAWGQLVWTLIRLLG